MTNRVLTFHGATLGVTEYDIPAVDVVVYDGEPLFLTATGVVGFGSDADQPVASIETGSLNLIPGAVCTVQRADALMSATGSVMLRATAEGFETPVPNNYTIPPAKNPTVESMRRISLGRGARGAEWTFRLVSSGGLWSLGLLSVETERRVRTNV